MDLNNARVSPGGGVRHPRPSDVRSGCGLPAHGWSGLKKLVHLQITTINIGAMMGRTREVANTLKQCCIDIACIQETKWKGAKAREIGDGYKLYYNGANNTCNGVGIVVNAKYQDSITEANQLSNQLMSLKIKSGMTALLIISCYTPQVGCPDDEKNELWDSLDTRIRSVEPEEHLVIGGDLNGHVGRLRDSYKQHHGGNGYGTWNEDGA